MGNDSIEITKTIPLHRVAVVLPFTRFLTDVGAPFERGFRRAGLPVCALEDPDNFVPSRRFWSFLVDMAYCQDIPDLGFRVGQRYGADCADPHLTDLLRRSPTLYVGLSRASDLINATISNCRVGLLQPPGSQCAHFYHAPSCDARNPAIEQIGWFGIMTLMGIVRVFVGPRWQPSEIGVMTRRAPTASIREQFPDARVRPGQPYSYITLEQALLSHPPLSHHAAAPGCPTTIYRKELSQDFVGAFEQVLASCLQEESLSIEFAARLIGTSRRSLQRKLAENGTCYSDVLEKVRFDNAIQMLSDCANKITDIAYLLGYDHPTHFSRAFRRLAGVAPHVYRQRYSH